MAPHINLDNYLSGHIFAFVLIFTRIGSAMMLMPGIGERYVMARARLALTFAICLLVMEPLFPRLPTMPPSIGDLVRLLTCEAIIGVFFGTILRIFLSVLEAAGTVIGLQTGLSSATVLNPALASQSPLPSALLSVLGTTLIFVTGLDHVLLQSLVALYNLFPPGAVLMPGDMTETVLRLTNQAFVLGIELAMPFFVIGLLMYVALGMIQKLLPNLQLFLIALPLQIWGGLIVLGLTVSSIMSLWLHYIDDTIVSLFGR